jgi:transposase, IS30 family
MRGYKQLSYDERVKLAKLRQSESSITEIASALGRSKSTISRELRRNQAPPGEYWPDTAQKLAHERCQRMCRLDKDEGLRTFVLNQIQCHYWTPEQISGWLKHRQKELKPISHESIYAWLYQEGQKKDKLWKFLPRHKSKRGLRKYRGTGVERIPHRVSIHERPAHIQKRRAFGHWEGDLMSFMKNTQHMVVLQERKSRFILSSLLTGKKACHTVAVITRLLEKLPLKARRSITLDNGGEFAAHTTLTTALGMQSFFCDPYASWQKGGVENDNGRLRRDLPRKTNILALSQEDFNETIQNYNTTPRKCLGWLTPLEAFTKNLNRVALHS